MAKDNKKDPQEYTVEEKLKSLYQLQLIFSEIDRMYASVSFMLLLL